MCINEDNVLFKRLLSSNYVDKTGIIAFLNKLIDTENRFICVTRARRFGKSATARTLNAYYSKGCDSKELFSNLEIAKDPDFETHLNKHDVIFLDMQSYVPATGSDETYLQRFNRELTHELVEHYPELASEQEHLHLNELLPRIGRKFIFIIDEWDFPIERYKDDPEFIEKYLDVLRRLFKETTCANCVSLVYMTGILPLIRFDSQSSLNNFIEFTMVNSGPIAKFCGFTEDEVAKLCKEHDLDPDKVRLWYKGYRFGEYTVYNPFEISKLIWMQDYFPYWSHTATCGYMKNAISNDYANLHEDLIRLCAGDKISNLDLLSMNNLNTHLNSKDAVLLYLVTLGYLTYDIETGSVFPPTEETRNDLVSTIEELNWQDYKDLLSASNEILESLLLNDEKRALELFDLFIKKEFKSNSSLFGSKTELKLKKSLLLSLLATERYFFIPLQSDPRFKEIADLVYIPKYNYRYDKYKFAIFIRINSKLDITDAICKIKESECIPMLKKFADRGLLVNINYEANTQDTVCNVKGIEF